MMKVISITTTRIRQNGGQSGRGIAQGLRPTAEIIASQDPYYRLLY